MQSDHVSSNPAAKSIQAQSSLVKPFSKKIAEEGVDLSRLPLTTLQINVGKLCNQACTHCHVEAGPNKKRENMSEETVDKLIAFAKQTSSLTTIDITGGAPELNPNFRRMVKTFRDMNLEVIDRCNLTVLFEVGQGDTAQFLADNKVTIVASLPCYSEKNVNDQRGDGVFAKSIRALQLLNSLGYGDERSGLVINLVYNPGGAFLPPDQMALEADYKKKLWQDFGIKFNNLFCLVNMPIKRFMAYLKRENKLSSYMKLLADNFNPYAAEGVMCRSLISIGWDGRVYDCDFNQMLDIPIAGKELTIDDLLSVNDVSNMKIALANHCYGCTAGAGSSCGGSLA